MRGVLLMLLLGMPVVQPHHIRAQGGLSKSANVVHNVLSKRTIISAAQSKDKREEKVCDSSFTTLFDNLDVCPDEFPEPFNFSDIDFDTPVALSDVDEDLTSSVTDVVQEIHNVIIPLVNSLRQADTKPATYEQLLETLDDFNDTLNNNEETFDLFPQMVKVGDKIVQGAMAGTSGGDRNEEGCDFQETAGKIAICVMRKLDLATTGMEIVSEDHMDALNVEECDQVIQFFNHSLYYTAAVDDISEHLSASLDCITTKLDNGKKALDDRVKKSTLPALLDLFGFSSGISYSYMWMGLSLSFAYHMAETEIAILEYEAQFAAGDSDNTAPVLKRWFPEEKQLKDTSKFIKLADQVGFNIPEQVIKPSDIN